jgi:hypothetical protein
VFFKEHLTFITQNLGGDIFCAIFIISIKQRYLIKVVMVASFAYYLCHLIVGGQGKQFPPHEILCDCKCTLDFAKNLYIVFCFI